MAGRRVPSTRWRIPIRDADLESLRPGADELSSAQESLSLAFYCPSWPPGNDLQWNCDVRWRDCPGAGGAGTRRFRALPFRRLVARPPQGSTTSSNTRRARRWRSGSSIVSPGSGVAITALNEWSAGRLPPLPGGRSPSTASSSSRSKSHLAGPWACGGRSRSRSSCGFMVHGSSMARPMDIPPTPRSALGSRRKGWPCARPMESRPPRSTSSRGHARIMDWPSSMQR